MTTMTTPLCGECHTALATVTLVHNNVRLAHTCSQCAIKRVLDGPGIEIQPVTWEPKREPHYEDGSVTRIDEQVWYCPCCETSHKLSQAEPEERTLRDYEHNYSIGNRYNLIDPNDDYETVEAMWCPLGEEFFEKDDSDYQATDTGWECDSCETVFLEGEEDEARSCCRRWVP